MIKGAIFDVDGTLFDSMFIWDTVGEDYLRSLGYAPKENLNKTFKSMSLYQAAQYYINEYGVTLSVEEIENGVNGMIEHYYKDIVPLKKGVKELLEMLNNRGVKMCIATATDRYMVESALKRCEVDKYFSEIFTCASVGHGKDEPIIFREAMRHLGTEKKDTVVFEDALYAVKTAKNDDFLVFGIYDCHEENQAEIKNLADVYLLDFSDFSTFLKRRKWNENSTDNCG